MLINMIICYSPCSRFLFFFNDPATTEIYTLSLHDALPISCRYHRYCLHGTAERHFLGSRQPAPRPRVESVRDGEADRKSTRLNSSHTVISYAVFCLKKKNKNKNKKIASSTYTTLQAQGHEI